MRTFLRLLPAIALVTAAGGTLLPQAANASVSPRVPKDLSVVASSCPSSTFCLYSGVGFSGTRWEYDYGSHSHNTWLYVGDGANDQAESLANNRAWTTKVGQNFPQSGGYRCLNGSLGISDLSQTPYQNNSTRLWHTISSFDLKTSLVSSCTSGA